MVSYDLLLDRIEKNATDSPDKTAATFLNSGPNGGKVERALTYKQLTTEMNAVAARLQSEGIRPGDRAVLVYPPSLDYMIAFLACQKAGIVAVPVFPPNPARRDTLHMFSSICSASGATIALTSTSYNYLKKLASIKEAVSRLTKRGTAWPDNLRWIATNDGKTVTPTPKLNFVPKRSDLAFLQFTSGSTSEPKGVMITHGNLAHNLTIITSELKAVNDTIVVSWLPQYHDMGLIGSYLGILYCSGSGYYLSPLTFLQRPMVWIEAVSKYKATHLQAPNFGFKLTAKKFAMGDDKLDLSSVRHVINAAEPVTEDAIHAFEQVFSKFGFNKDAMFPTYGLAEHTVFVCSGGKQRLTVDRQELEANGKVVVVLTDDTVTTTSRLIGCGFPANQGVDVRIVDRETSVEVGDSMVGEIWVHSDSKASGYYEKPQESKEDFCAPLKSGGEYLRTGDLGFLYNKELFICGRLKDLIIVAGRNYYPQDIEATAEACNKGLRPGCSAAFTIDPTAAEEEVALLVELRDVPSGDTSKAVCETIVDTVRGAINQEHSLGISQIILLKPKTVPKTTSGKIARSWCRKGFLGNTLQVVYHKSFKTNQAFEIEGPAAAPARALSQDEIDTLRTLDKKELVVKLKTEVAKVSGSASDDIAADVPISTLLDSLSVSQFKGLLEVQYAVKISDEYLFQESSSLNRLAEVVKLGYAPDDGDGGAVATSQQGQPGGIAGALGCPPGVYCVIQ